MCTFGQADCPFVHNESTTTNYNLWTMTGVEVTGKFTLKQKEEI